MTINNVVNYDAQGDGTTEDTAAIQDAVDDLPPGGGAVYLPEGTYRTHELYLDSNILMYGAGPGATRIQFIDDVEAYENTINIRGNDDEKIEQCGVRGLTVDGNRTNIDPSDNEGIVIDEARNCFVFNVRVIDASEDGIDINNAESCTVAFSEARRSGKAGIHLSRGTQHNLIIGSFAVNNQQNVQWRAGITCVNGGIHNCYIGNTAKGNRRNYQFEDDQTLCVGNISIGGEVEDDLNGVVVGNNFTTADD